jgi:PKD repeat protein
VIFYNVSASGGTAPYTYLWDFGDGTTSTEQNPAHVFPSGANYTVTVTARDANRHAGTKTNTITPLPVNTPAVADMTVSVYGWTVTLTDLSYDTDYNTCGHSGPGTIEIMWADYTRTKETIDLTDIPTPRTYTHTYTTANSNASHFDIIRDNVGVQSQAYKAVSIPTTYTVGGRVANASGVGLYGAIIYLRTMSGGVPSIGSPYAYTDANGYYTISGTAVDGECYILKQPFKSGWSYTFTPGDQTVCSSNMNVNWTSSP